MAELMKDLSAALERRRQKSEVKVLENESPQLAVKRTQLFEKELDKKQEGSPRGKDLVSLLAHRRNCVDAATMSWDEFADGSPSGKNRPKRTAEGMQRVMEARREHIAAMEAEQKRQAAAGVHIDADMALAMGSDLLHQKERAANPLQASPVVKSPGLSQSRTPLSTAVRTPLSSSAKTPQSHVAGRTMIPASGGGTAGAKDARNSSNLTQQNPVSKQESAQGAVGPSVLSKSGSWAGSAHRAALDPPSNRGIKSEVAKPAEKGAAANTMGASLSLPANKKEARSKLVATVENKEDELGTIFRKKLGASYKEKYDSMDSYMPEPVAVDGLQVEQVDGLQEESEEDLVEGLQM